MRAVPRTPELARILGLPRRGNVTWEDLIDPLSEFLRLPNHVCRPPGTNGPTDLGCANGFTRLNILQTQGLCEFHDFGGLWLQGPLGCGKTGVALFAPTLLETIEPQRPLYIVPGSAIKSGKVFSEITILREHWRILNLQIVSYQKLAREEQEFFFFEPPGPYTTAILDEAHYCRNEETAVTRRIERLREKAGQRITIVRIGTGQKFDVLVPPAPRTAVMTATPLKDSVADVAHTMKWSHGRGAPLPLDRSDLSDWCGALDAEPPERLGPGALTVFSEGRDDLESVRKGVGKWIFDTPGFVSSSETFVKAKLDIALRDVPLTEAEDLWFKVLRGDPDDLDNFPGGMTPDGDIFTDAKEQWRHACSLALGYFTKWDPAAPPLWRLLRKRWHAWAREILKESRTIDTLAQLATAVDHGKFDDYEIPCGNKIKAPREILGEWREIQPTFVLCPCDAYTTCPRPHSVPVWVGDTALKYAEKWLEGGGIVWTGHRHFRLELARRTGVPCFGQGGLTPDGSQSIVTTKAKAIIASTVACGAMFNLQDRYWRNLVASIWPTAYMTEQMIGRTHRQGQLRDLVTFEWMISCREQLDGFARSASCQAPMLRDFMKVPSRLCGARVASDKISTSGWAFRAPGE